jgi:FKBP-type peptidyl-prolyl cis-trans isomerase SlpA|tara:strand:- start:2396 stop:2836 length:441 start_codon:yes stop_codon:yes gene_type:complete
MSIPIDTGTTVTLHFSLALEDGAVVDSNFEGKPATFSIGDGSLLPGFEETLFGLRATDAQEFLVPPEKAFGQHNEQNVQAVAMDNFIELEIDIGAMFSFQNGDGELPGVITDIVDGEVMVDFNHPLAGKNIVFQVKILGVVPENLH